MTVFHPGVNNSFAVERRPMLADWAEICSAELDVSLVQFSFDLLDPRTNQPALSSMISLTKDALHETGLTIHSTFTGLAAYSCNLLTHPDLRLREDVLGRCASAIEMTSRFAVKVTGGHVGALSRGDYRDAKRRRFLETVLVDSLQRLSLLTANEGLEMLLWELMPLLRESPCTIADSRRLLGKVAEKSRVPIKLATDTGHQCAAGVENKTTMSMHG